MLQDAGITDMVMKISSCGDLPEKGILFLKGQAKLISVLRKSTGTLSRAKTASNGIRLVNDEILCGDQWKYCYS